MCFSDKGFLEIYSVFHKERVVFSIPIIPKKAIMPDATKYFTHHRL